MSYATEEVPEVVLAFREALEDLRRNDQYEIENLTMIAKESTEHAQAISHEVEAHIKRTRPEHKLPGLYLLDSLVKHIGTPYTVYLGRNLSGLFFGTYTVVDTNTRRAMEELFRSWTQPAPESRDPRPVFPIEITGPMGAILQKMQGIHQRTNVQQVPPHMTGSPYGRNTPPNNQYQFAPPNQQRPPPGYPPQTLPYGSHPPPFQQPVRSPVPQMIPPPSRQGAHSATPQFQPPPSQAGMPNQYVYTGPPPSTMSHQDRLGKLRYDVSGLLDSVRNHLAAYPQDQEKLKLVSNLQSLKGLLDSGSLSLTHIQSTEIVVANIARDLPFRPPTATAQVPTPVPQPNVMQPQAPVSLDPNLIASILARNTPQPTPSQPAAPYAYAPPPPVASTPHYPLSVPPPSTPGTLPPNLASLLAGGKPPLIPGQPAPPPAAGGGLNLLDQLRASGLLGATPVQSTPVQAPAAASILSQLMQPQPSAQALNDVKLEAASLKIHRFHLIRQLYEDKPDQCKQCGMRFPGTEQGKKAKGVHIDWHFKVASRVQDSARIGVHRSWYIDERDWISYREELGGYSGIVTDGTAAAKSGKKESKEQFVFVPTDARLVNLPCSICQEKFEQGWDEETQQPTWKDAVKVGNKYYHASCYAEVSRGAAAAPSSLSVAMERTGSSSARSTPDPVLGKRRFDDFRIDATLT